MQIRNLYVQKFQTRLSSFLSISLSLSLCVCSGTRCVPENLSLFCFRWSTVRDTKVKRSIFFSFFNPVPGLYGRINFEITRRAPQDLARRTAARSLALSYAVPFPSLPGISVRVKLLTTRSTDRSLSKNWSHNRYERTVSFVSVARMMRVVV